MKVGLLAACLFIVAGGITPIGCAAGGREQSLLQPNPARVPKALDTEIMEPEGFPRYTVGKTTEAEFRKMWEGVQDIRVSFHPPARGRPPLFPGMTLDSAPTWTDAGLELPDDWASVVRREPSVRIRGPHQTGEPVMDWRLVGQDASGRSFWQGTYWDGERLRLYGVTFRKGILEAVHGPVDAD